jgi:uncharacterized protein (UPF0335 family)
MTTRIETEDVVERLQSAIWKLLLSATSVDADVRNEADDAMKEAVASIERLREENARMTEALSTLADVCEQRRVKDFDPESRVTVLETRTKDILDFHEALDEARAALTPSADDDK